MDAGIRIALRCAASTAAQRNQLTGRRPSAICSPRVGRAYTSASRFPRTGVAALRLGRGQVERYQRGRRAPERVGPGRRGPSLAPAACCGCFFSFRARHLSRLGHAARRDSGRCHAAVSGSVGRLRRWSGLGSRAELHFCSRGPGARFNVGDSPGRRTNRHLKVCLGCRGTRGGERDLQSSPVVTHVFRPRSRGGSCECPFWLGRRERHVGPGRTAPKKGGGSTGRIGGRPGTARNTRTDGLADMTRSSWRSGEPSKLSISSDRLRSDCRVVLGIRRSPGAERSSLSVTRLPPTGSRTALSLGHAQHVGHQCRYR